MRLRALIAVLALTLGVASTTRSQSSEYFIVDGGGLVSVLQNGAVVRTWNQRADAMPVAVAGGTLRTYAEFLETGSEYDLMGNWTGTDYPATWPDGQKVDGTTDGSQYNWIAAWGAKAIFRTDRDWTNIKRQFNVSGGPTGVAYDASTGNLWVIDHGSKLVVEYDQSGNVLSSFPWSTQSSWMGCLAWEGMTDTLWSTDFSNGDVYQYDKAGTLLQSFNVPGIAGYAWGGEFELGGCYARSSNYGQGYPGTLGVPGIVANSPPRIGQNVSITADNSYGVNRIGGYLVIGLQKLQVTGNWGGDLLVTPILFQAVSIPVSGLILGGTIPNDPNLCGIPAYLQVLEFDPGATNGISNTPGLELVFGN